jgi:nucleotide-binding universal stress UspA family protein
MYHHIIAPLDGSPLAECVLPHVETAAAGCQDPKVTLVRVVEPLHIRGGLESRLVPEERQRLEEEDINAARSYLDQLVNQLKGKGIKRAQAEVLYGNVIDQLVDYMNKSNADLIVIASHGRSGISRWVWGSVADKILRSSCVPVLIVRAPGCVPGV